MRFWKAWFDIRQRFVLCFVLVTLLVAPETVSVAVSSAQAGAVAEAAGANVEEGTLEAAEAYARMVGSWSGPPSGAGGFLPKPLWRGSSC